MSNSNVAIFLSGPIGAGKSTLGAALARALQGVFVEGDEHADPNKPWYASALSTARSIAGNVVTAAATGRPVVIAYPLRCRDWVFYSSCLATHDIRTIVISLGASYHAIISPARGRRFSADERTRILQMMVEGYDRRPFSDLMVQTDRESVAETLPRLIEGLSQLRRIAVVER